MYLRIGFINMWAYFDLYLRDLEAALVLRGQNHTGSLLPSLCEEPCNSQSADKTR